MKPHNTSALEMEIATFYCSANGNPTPKITWSKDGKTVGQGETLNITVNRNDSGKYWCAADNGLREAVNASAYLDVQCKYKIRFYAWQTYLKIIIIIMIIIIILIIIIIIIIIINH